MRQNKHISLEATLRGFSQWDGVNVISSLFNQNEIKEKCQEIVSLMGKCTFMEDPVCLSEKCMFVLNDIPVRYAENDPLSLAAGQVEKMDFHAFYLQLNSPKTISDGNSPFDDVFLMGIFKNQPYYDQFCEIERLTKQEKELLDDYKNKVVNSHSIPVELPHFITEEKRLKTFFIFNIAVELETYLEQEAKKQSGTNPKEALQCFRAAKQFVESNLDKYELWESSTIDKVQQAQYMWSLDFWDYLLSNEDNNSTSDEVQLILVMFLAYYSVYSSEWSNFIFGHELPKHCDTPVNTLHFIQNLREHKYGRDFCKEYDNYLNRFNGKPLFNTKIIIPSAPSLITDDNKEHKDWFRKIDKTKVNSRKDSELYDAVRELYYKLKENEYISEATPESLFIYRFTGFLVPQPLEIKISWTGVKFNVLAYIFKCLFTRKEGETVSKPSYSKLTTFFTPEMSNGSGLADSLESRKKGKVRDMLLECGFVNVDPSKIK